MKRAIAMSLCALSLSGIIPAAGAANTVTATPTEFLGQTVMYDNWPVGISAYNIANNNYFKLRDLGNLLDFAVDYDAATQTVTLGDLSTSYTLVEGEQAKELRDIGGLLKWFVGAPKGMVQPMPATISDSKFSMNGKPVSIAAYSIGGNNYVKLRDVSELVGFGVDFNAVSRVVYLSANGETYQEYLANRQAEYAAQQAADEAQKQAEAAEQIARDEQSRMKSDAELRALAMEAIEATNAERTKAGLPAYTVNEKLMEAAKIRAQEQTISFSHTRPNGQGGSTAIWETGIEKSSVGPVGENLAGAGYNSGEAVVTRLMKSEGHRNQILDPECTEIGVGVVQNQYGQLLWVQLFIGPR